MQPPQSLPEPAPGSSPPLAPAHSVGRFGAGLRGQTSSTTAVNPQLDGHRAGSSLPSSPRRSAAILEPVQLAPPLADVSINYFTYGATKDTMIRSPDLHRHVLSTSFDTEAARQVAQVCTLSSILQGPVDPANAGTPMASGPTAPGHSPYLQPLSSRKRAGAARPAGDPASAPARPGLPMPLRPLSSLLDTGVVGALGAGVRRARRHGGGGGSPTWVGAGGPHPGGEESAFSASNTTTATSSGRGTSSTVGGTTGAERSSPTIPGVMSRMSQLSSLYGQPSAAAVGGGAGGGGGGGEASSSDDGGEGRGGGGGGMDSTRYYYLSKYAPPLHLPPSAAAAGGGAGAPPEDAITSGGGDGQDRPSSSDSAAAGAAAAGPPALAAMASSISIAGEADDLTLQGHLAHLLNLHLHLHLNSNRQQQQQQPNQQQPQLLGPPQTSLPLPQQTHTDSAAGPLPALGLRSAPRSHRASSASSACSFASSTAHNPLAPQQQQQQHERQREHSMPDRAASWRRSVAADGGGGSGGRRSMSSQQVRPIGAQLSGTLEEWVRQNHSVHSIVPDSHVRAQANDLWVEGRQQQQQGRWHQRNGGTVAAGDGSEPPEAVAAVAAAAAGPGDRRSSGGEDAAAAIWGRPRRRRGPIHVDPELVRQYTERPPKLCTPNNASRPVTSSDFVAFKNHTVNRAGTANTLRTVLGSNEPAGGGAGGASGGGGAAAVAPEARGVTPLTTLLGPSWVTPAFRPRSPYLGVGGVTGSATCVPGLHVPLELDPPPRPLPASAAGSSPSGPHPHLLRRSAELSDGVSSLGSPGAIAAAAAAAAAGERAGTPLTASTFGAASSVPAPVHAVAAPRAGPPPHVRCGAGELVLDVNAWLTPPTAPPGEMCGLFNGDDGESVALLSRVVKGAVQCDLGWAEVSESLMFMSSVTVPNAVLRFPVPHRAILQRFAATIGGTTLIAEGVARSGGGGGIELEEDEEEDDPGPGKVFAKGFGRRNHPPGPGGRAPMLRVPLGKIRGDIFITISYVVQLEAAGNTLSLTHVCNWTPARTGWHLAMARDQLMSTDGSSWLNNAPPGRRTRHKPSDLYDLSFELEILSHRGLNLVSGPRHMAIKPNYDALLIQGYTQVWRPRHVTTVTFELALPVPLRSFAILQDAARAGPDTGQDPSATTTTGLLRRTANPINTHDSDGGGGSAAAAATAAPPPPTAGASSLRLIVPTDLAHLNPGADSGKGTITLRSAPPAAGLNLEPRPLSTRHCAAVTFVPGSHFSPAELEDLLGPEVAPGPRAQAAAIRAGMPGGPGPLPVELWVVLDCCGPAGIAAHLMQMLQTLQVLLRSLPVTEAAAGGAGSAAGTATGAGGSTIGGSSVTGSMTSPGAAAVAAATLFNVVCCPAAPLVLDSEEEEAASALWPPGLASLHFATRQQQHQALRLRQRQQAQQQQQQQPTGDADADADADAAGSPPPQDPDGSLSQHHLLQQRLLLAQEDVAALPPLWLFPAGSRPVNGENVGAALVWVEALLADAPMLAAWAQPVSALHDLLADVAWSPRPAGCRRAAVVLCQQIPSPPQPNADGADAEGGHGAGQGGGGRASTAGGGRPLMSSSPSRRFGGGGGGGGGVSRLTSRHLSVVNQAAGGQVGGGRATGGGGGRAASARLRLKLGTPGDSESAGSRSNSRSPSRANSRPPSRCLSRSTSRATSPDRAASPATNTRPGSRPGSPKSGGSPTMRRGLNFGDLPAVGYAKAAAAAVAASPPAQAAARHEETGGGGGGGGQERRVTTELGGSAKSGQVISVAQATAVQTRAGRSAGASPEPYRPRSSMARGGAQGRSGAGGADGVRWSNGVVSNPRRRIGGGAAATESDFSDSDPEAMGRSRATGPSPLRGGGGGGGGSASAADGTGTSGDEDEELSTGPPAVEPPDVGFPVFVVVQDLPPPPTSAALAAGFGGGGGGGASGAAGGPGSSGPSYLLAYQLYQKHIESLLYRHAREEVEQLPLSYFERLSDLHGGFVQVVSSPLELSAALVLAASCAVNGRYLRQLRVVARGSVVREQYPARLPAALPLSEPLSLLVRLSRMQPGAALELQGVWPNGRPAHMGVSVDPRLRTTGQMLPVLCALSEVSSLLKEFPLKDALPRISVPGGTTAGGAGGTASAGAVSRSTSVLHLGGAAAAAAAVAAAAAAAAAAAGWPPVRLTPQQHAARRKATHKAEAFNMVTPFTAMALVSMTLTSNRGLTVQTLQTTQGRPGDHRHAFVWPAPVMAALAAAAKDAAQLNTGASSPYHTAATFAAAAAAAAAAGGAGAAPGGGPPGPAPGQGQVLAPPGQLELPAECIAMVSGTLALPSESGELGDAKPTPPGDATAAAAGSTDPGVTAGASDSEHQQQQHQHRQGARSPGTGLLRVRSRRRSEALQELTGAIAGSMQAAKRANALGFAPVAAVSPDVATLLSYRLSGSGAGSPPYASSRRPSAMDPHDFPPDNTGGGGSSSGGWGPAAAAPKPKPGQAPPPLQLAPYLPVPDLSTMSSFVLQPGGGGGAATAAAAGSSPAAAAPAPAGPFAPPMSPAACVEAHQLTVLGRLAAMQGADGSWPAVPELEELVVSNGRNLVVPVLGGPRPASQIERNAAEARDVLRREALVALRDQTLRGAVCSSCWSTVLALALLRSRYAPQRLTWIPMEARAFAWLHRKWPAVSSCGMSAPAAIMRISALL